MVDREAATLTPPPPAEVESDLDRAHRNLARQLADHADPKVRILAHISNRQFDLSERLSSMQQDIRDGFAKLQNSLGETKRDLGDKIDRLDAGYTEVEERTTELERHSPYNGSSSTSPQ